MKKTIEINVPDIANITVSGPVQCGKSIVVDRIKRMLESEFNAQVISKDWREEGDIYRELADWEKKMVRCTVWNISEPVEG